MAKILVVDDQQSMREFLEILLGREGHEVQTAGDVAGGIAACDTESPELLFADLKLPDGTGMDLLRWTRENKPDTQVIMMTAFATAENAVEAMRLGAYDYQLKPFKVDEVRVVAQKALEKAALLRENRELKERLRSHRGLRQIIGRSAGMGEVIRLIEKVAPTRTNILIEGESGTGKELVARAIHEASPRQGGPFVPVNCGAIPEALMEAELFGHSSGAFTGAHRSRSGLFEAASGGTLLLDEVSELPPAVQVKLLRALQERSVRRVGEEHERPVDVRIVASTNRALNDAVRANAFREDLFYRLNVVRIRLPSLRERVDDVPVLARAFLVKYAQEIGTSAERIADDAMRALQRYEYPGNVRELENIIERAVALTPAEEVRLQDLPEEVRGAPPPPPRGLTDLPEGGIDLDAELGAAERRLIEAALDRAGGVKKVAAELLGLSFRSFRYRLQKLGFDSSRDESDV